jgi:polyhydroxybutyrate depolymerase
MRAAPFALALLVFASSSAAYGQGQVINSSLRLAGRLRTYSLYIPASYTGEAAWPLVLNLHGAFSNGEEQMLVSGMNEVADTGNFLVAYPNSQGQFWNNSLSPGAADDIGFITALLDELQNAYNVDSSRVYATGLSDGGLLSYYLASEMSDRIAAVASVAGPLNRTAPRPLPVLHIHGTADPFARINGGPFRIPPFPATVFPAVQDVIESWRGSNQCVDEAVVTELSDLDIEDGSTVDLIHYEDCAPYLTSSGEERSSEVLYYMIHSGGHTWPGEPPGVPSNFGHVNRDINASTEIWNFFSRHALPVTMSASVLGDYCENGVVEQADLDLVLLNWGAAFDTLPAEWIDQRPTSGIVDQGELDGVLLNWGNTSAIGAPGGVPEPGTLLLVGLLVATAAVRRCAKRRQIMR